MYSMCQKKSLLNHFIHVDMYTVICGGFMDCLLFVSVDEDVDPLLGSALQR